MLSNFFLSYALLKAKGKHRGVAITEYAILLAFIAVIGVAFFVLDYDFVWGKNDYGEDVYLGQSLSSSILASLMNVLSTLTRLLNL